MSKIYSKKFIINSIIATISLVLIVFIFKMNISSSSIYYEFQFDSETTKLEKLPVTLDIDVSSKYDNIPIDKQSTNYVLSNKVKFPIDPRSMESNSMMLFSPDLSVFESVHLNKINILEKKGNGFKLKGSIVKSEFEKGVSYSDGKIIIEKGVSKQLADIAYQNWNVKILLVAIVIATLLIFFFLSKNRFLYTSIAAFFLCISFFALSAQGNYFFGKSYYYNSGELNKFELLPSQKFTQNFETPRKRFSSVDFNLFFPNDNGKESEELSTKPQAFVKLIDKANNDVIDEQYVFDSENEDGIIVSLGINDSTKNSKNKNYEIVIENISTDNQNIQLETATESSNIIKESSLSNEKLKLTLLFNTYPVNVIGMLIIILVILVYLLVVVLSKYVNNPAFIIVPIYIIGICIFGIQMKVEQNVLEGYWDPNAHLSFVASLEDTKTNILPDYGKQFMTKNDFASSAKKLGKTDELSGIVELEDGNTNYQGHPPLYHQLLRFLGGTKKIDDKRVYVNFSRLLLISNIISLLSVSIWFVIGYLYIKKDPIFHWLYVSIITGSSILIYASSQLGNDVIGLLAVGLTIFALFGLSNKKYTLVNYIALALGISMGLLTKVNVGAVVAITTGLFFIHQLIQRNFKILFNWKFFATLLIYVGPLYFYLKMYMVYGVFMQSFAKIDPVGFYQGSFYQEFIYRESVKSISEFIYWFYATLVDNFSFQPLKNNNGLLTIIWKTLTQLSICIYLGSFLIRMKSWGDKWLIIRFTSFGSFIFLINLYLNTYNRYYLDGYLGGVQGRYFLYAVPIIALSCTWFIQMLVEKNSELKNNNFVGNKTRGSLLRPMTELSAVQTHLLFFSSTIILFGGFLFAYIL